MNIVTNIPFTDILLAILAVGLFCWLLYRGFNPKQEDKSGKSKSSNSSGTKSKPSAPGININIGGTNTSNSTADDNNVNGQ